MWAFFDSGPLRTTLRCRRDVSISGSDAPEAQLGIPDFDDIAILEGSFVCGGAIDEGAVGAKLIFEADGIRAWADEEGKVVAGDLGVL